MDSERFGEFTASFDGTAVFLEGRYPADETLTVDRHNLRQLEYALAWAKARLTPICATCPYFAPTRTDEGTPIALCNYAVMKGGLPAIGVALDGSDSCHHHPDLPKD